MNTSVEYMLMMGHTDVEEHLRRKRLLRIRKAMSNYQLNVHNKKTEADSVFLDEVIAVEREFQHDLEQYNKLFDKALYFDREKGE